MAIASFVFSAVALALSGAAFGWQILSWFMSGGRVKASLRIGAMNPAGYVTSPPSALRPGWFERLAEDGFFQPIVAVQVNNHGRLPVYVNKWAIETDKLSFTPIADSIGPDLPYKLEPGQEVTWAMGLDQVLKVMKSRDIVGGSDICTGYVVLGTGKKVRTANDVRERQISDAAG